MLDGTGLPFAPGDRAILDGPEIAHPSQPVKSVPLNKAMGFSASGNCAGDRRRPIARTFWRGGLGVIGEGMTGEGESGEGGKQARFSRRNPYGNPAPEGNENPGGQLHPSSYRRPIRKRRRSASVSPRSATRRASALSRGTDVSQILTAPDSTAEQPGIVRPRDGGDRLADIDHPNGASLRQSQK
ncbi:MAG: hypothetical protein R3F11_20220 [Verrucomicrobiales bacterium]